MSIEESSELESQILASLDPDQAIAAQSLQGPTSIIAGAGSGKTRTISHRIALGIAKGIFTPNRVLALTYTNRAAAELRLRLRQLGAGAVQVRTFHSAALSQLQYFWPQLTGERAPKLLTSKYKMLKEIAELQKLRISDSAVRDLAAEIEWRKYSMVDLAQYETLERSTADLSSVKVLELTKLYEEQKLSKKLIDWEDVLLLCLGMLESEPRILSHVQAQYRFFTVDEYQDISPLQQALLDQWLGDRSELCVVGDPRQTIYSFSGAASHFLTGFDLRYPDANVIQLTRNYRSSNEIVLLANKVLDAEPLQSQLGNRGAVSVREFKSDREEASWIINKIQELLSNGTSAREIAVLTRMNFQLEQFEKQLQELGIPAQIRGSGRFFQNPDVLHASAAIRALSLKSDREPLFIELSNILSSMGWTSKEQSTDKWENLNWFIQIMEELGEQVELEEYLRELDERQRSMHEPIRNAVTLATVHSAKGLEWDAVFLPNLNEGSFPIHHANSASALEEERRLYYVAVTRAKTRLYLSSSEQRPASVFLNYSR
jgi:DNA helicase-2/ATP-dependent DNA helicase PcrA